MIYTRLLLFACLTLTIVSCQQDSPTPSQTVAKWQLLQMDFPGPQTSEQAEDNPFLNYRLDVVFTHGEHSMTVP
ncbi:MAG: DUF5060 domain-containing protein, partial [Bacteroidota bacterium]